MKLPTFLTTVFLFIIFYVPAQPRLINCSAERNADNTISILAESQIKGDYTVKLIFSSLEGYTCDKSLFSNVALVNVHNGRYEIAKLVPEKNAHSFRYSYNYYYYPGTVMHRKPDTAFAYLLPVTEGTQLRISHVSYMGEIIGKKSEEGFMGINFMYKPGDTICAARAGTVYDCSDKITEGEKPGEFFKTDRNKISIQHRDGTLAYYSILSPIKLLIEPGDEVMPGQPLAVFNVPSEKCNVLFSVSYLDEKKTLVNNRDVPTSLSPYQYVPALFYATENGKAGRLELYKLYTSARTKELIGAELSKREKKKLGL